MRTRSITIIGTILILLGFLFIFYDCLLVFDLLPKLDKSPSHLKEVTKLPFRIVYNALAPHTQNLEFTRNTPIEIREKISLAMIVLGLVFIYIGIICIIRKSNKKTPIESYLGH